MEVTIMMGERTTRMESHYEAIQGLLHSDKERISRILYAREVKTLRKSFPQVEIKIESIYKGSLYNCVISK